MNGTRSAYGTTPVSRAIAEMNTMTLARLAWLETAAVKVRQYRTEDEKMGKEWGK